MTEVDKLLARGLFSDAILLSATIQKVLTSADKRVLLKVVYGRKKAEPKWRKT